MESQGYSVITAENGPDALAIFSAKTVDLVVLDYAMPGMDGGVVAKEMKAVKPAVPIILYSAYIDLPEETRTFVDQYVTKGEPPRVLLEAIAKLFVQDHTVRSAT